MWWIISQNFAWISYRHDWSYRRYSDVEFNVHKLNRSNQVGAWPWIDDARLHKDDLGRKSSSSNHIFESINPSRSLKRMMGSTAAARPQIIKLVQSEQLESSSMAQTHDETVHADLVVSLDNTDALLWNSCVLFLFGGIFERRMEKAKGKARISQWVVKETRIKQESQLVGCRFARHRES